ncbi:hypothetical protein BDV93DRAFT_545883 [Ceratobasidium sp. AG-I]|nr:hypothetical protein BDV93DRAFT_545883 [Ceratobasidium sp. AG-I]
MPNYYIRRNNRRATMDAKIEDNWVELDTPEFTLATSSPAIAVPGGKLGVHIGRIGVTLSSAVPHGISNANSLLHGQVTRRYSADVPASSWSSFLTPERKEPRTRSAFALVNNIASVIAFAPNPGSPPTGQAPLPRRSSTASRSAWLHLLPANEPSEQGGALGLLDKDVPELIHSHMSEDGDDSVSSISDGSEAQMTRIYPSPPLFEQPQILILGPSAFLHESPVPLTSGTGTTSYTMDVDEQQLANMFTGSASSCDASSNQPISYRLAANASSTDPYLAAERLNDFLSPTYLGSTDEYYTSTDNRSARDDTLDSRRTDNQCERKLLIIGSRYDSQAGRSATTFTFTSELEPLEGTQYDVISLKSEFRKRHYSVHTLVSEEFDREAVLERLSEFLRSASKGDVRAIIFTGHALRILQDVVAIVPPYCPTEEDAIPAKLWEDTVKANTKPGVIVLSIFASCLSGGLMPQRVDLKPLSKISTADTSSANNVPIFITFASCGPEENSYESAVDLEADSCRLGDHFLRAITLAMRDSSSKDWDSFIAALDVNFAQIRQIGATCAAQSSRPCSTWLEDFPQNPVITTSDHRLPLYQSVFPSEISLIERPLTPVANHVNIADEFLAHVSLRGEIPEITHFTF